MELRHRVGRMTVVNEDLEAPCSAPNRVSLNEKQPRLQVHRCTLKVYIIRPLIAPKTLEYILSRQHLGETDLSTSAQIDLD